MYDVSVEVFMVSRIRVSSEAFLGSSCCRIWDFHILHIHIGLWNLDSQCCVLTSYFDTKLVFAVQFYMLRMIVNECECLTCSFNNR